MSEAKTNLPIESTPAINTNTPNTLLHTEAHRTSPEIKKNEENIIETRKEILKHYNIDKTQTVYVPASSPQETRDICAFFILKNKKRPDEIYYADGHTAHANLLQAVLDKFGNQIGCHNRTNLPKNFLEVWETKKGFIDPYKNGFKKFESINYALRQIIEEQSKNADAFAEIDKIKTSLDKNNQVKLPNWFIVSNSSQQYKNKK